MRKTIVQRKGRIVLREGKLGMGIEGGKGGWKEKGKENSIKVEGNGSEREEKVSWGRFLEREGKGQEGYIGSSVFVKDSVLILIWTKQRAQSASQALKAPGMSALAQIGLPKAKGRMYSREGMGKEARLMKGKKK